MILDNYIHTVETPAALQELADIHDRGYRQYIGASYQDRTDDYIAKLRRQPKWYARRMAALRQWGQWPYWSSLDLPAMSARLHSLAAYLKQEGY